MDKLAIMQPYFFPYIGYFQLCAAVDTFVFYDDVNFIKQGWINRNRINLNGREHLFTIPLAKQSSYAKINEVRVSDERPWRDRVLKTFEQAYRNAPSFDAVFPMIRDVIQHPTGSIAELAKLSVTRVAEHLELKTVFKPSSVVYENDDLKAEARVLDICARERAVTYINVSGGKALYEKKRFFAHDIELRFIKSKSIAYPQQFTPEIPWPSIIDVLMNNSREDVKSFLQDYELE